MTDGKKTVAVMCFSNGNGGMEHDAIKLACLLGCDMKVVLFCKAGTFIHQTSQGADNNYRLEPVRFSSRTFSLSMLFRVRSLMRSYAPDNVIFFGASELKTLYFAFLGFDINLLVRHGTTKSHPKTDWFHRLIYSRVNYHIALSEHLLNNIKSIVPHAHESAYRIILPSYNIAPRKRDVDENNSGQLQITHVGRVASGKGQLDAVHASRTLQGKGIAFQLDFLGGQEGDNYVKRLQAEISASGFPDRIHLRGHVSNVTDYLEKTDIFLFPSEGEGMPNAFIEAMYYNNVCIAYKNTVFPEFLEMGFYIHLVKNEDVVALSKKLLDIADNLEDEKSRSSKNAILVYEYFQPERELAQWNDILA